MKYPKLKEKIKSWKPSDYIRQTSVVVVGVIITFGGNALFVRCSQEREVDATMSLVIEELKSNREKLDFITAEFNKEVRLSTMLSDCKMDFRQIPEDSLRKYNIVGQLRAFRPVRNAFNMLNTSGLLQQIPNKGLVLQLSTVYDDFDGVKESIDTFYSFKQEATIQYMFSLEGDKMDLIYYGDYPAWEVLLASPQVCNYLRIAQGYYSKGYLQNVRESTDQMITLLEQTYED